MNMRSQSKHAMRERNRHHFYVAGYKLKKGKRYEFRGTKDGQLVLSGWFVADRQNPVCRAL